MTSACDFIHLLSIPKLTEHKLMLLLQKYGPPGNIRQASFDELKVLAGEDVARAIRSPRIDDNIKKKCDSANRYDIQVLPFYDRRYPQWLKAIDGYPPVLFVRGGICPEDERAIALIGTRGATIYGRTIAERFGSAFARAGITVVSGMARGIDTAAHYGALKEKGRTIAVLGCGVDRCYPSENRQLMEHIISQGAVVSEFNIGTPPLAQHFPKRNRVVSGLSQAVVAIEAKEKSGVMNTVNWALTQNKDVFAVPGNIYAKTSHGTNRLIKDGAIPVTSPEEILESLGLRLSQTDPTNDVVPLTDREMAIWKRLSYDPKYLDVLSEELAQPTGSILDVLLSLELKGLVKQLPGMMFVKNYE